MIKTSYWKFSKILNIDEVIQQINSKLEKDVDEKSKIIINSIANEDIIIAQKKSAIKEADGFSYISIPIKNGSIGKAESQESLVFPC